MEKSKAEISPRVKKTKKKTAQTGKKFLSRKEKNFSLPIATTVLGFAKRLPKSRQLLKTRCV